MWKSIAHFIIRNRLVLLLAVIISTAFWGFMAMTRLEVNHKFADMLPSKDASMSIYKTFRSDFGEDGMVMIIGVKDKELFTLEKFNKWYQLGNDIKKIEGVDSVFSVAHMFNLVKDDSLKKFNLRPISPKGARNKKHVDSISEIVHSLPFYRNKLYNDSTGASLMMVFINPEKFNSEDRGTTVEDIEALTETYQDTFPEIHLSGLPYIRNVIFHTLKNEMRLFLILSALVSLIILYLFFRSFKIVAICLVQILVGITWSFGTMATFGFKVSSLMALIPPLITVIAVPNCIYLINRYQQEYVRYKNQMKAISHVIQKIGVATFLTNATTAVGFGTFVFTTSDTMIQFGIVAFINVFCLFFTSLIVIPVILSYSKPPSGKQVKHLERKWVTIVVNFLITSVTNYRKLVYFTMLAVLGVGAFGVYMMKTEGRISGDLSEGSRVLQDLKFIEENFGGTIPFEVVINTKKKGQLRQKKNLEKIEEFQEALKNIKNLSPSISLVDALKFINQSFYSGNIEHYEIPSKRDQAFLQKYFTDTLKNGKKANEAIKGFMDTSGIKTRITMQAADRGTFEIEAMEQKVAYIADTIFNKEGKSIDSLMSLILKSNNAEQKDTLLKKLYELNYRIQYGITDFYTEKDEKWMNLLDEDEENIYLLHREKDFNDNLVRIVDECTFRVDITGTSVLFAKGAHYMVDNLVTSLIYAIISISILMALLFRSFRMVLITMVPNVFPLIFTAAIMGFIGVPIKPSTILIFSIALGISIDDAIHFLAKYRQELKSGKSIRDSAIDSIHEVGVSMIYTSIVLFAGFSVFIFSDFGGTKALGVLLSITLAVAMICNLVILPTLLMTLDKWVNLKAMKEPLLDIYDEELDVELSELEIKKEEDSENNLI